MAILRSQLAGKKTYLVAGLLLLATLVLLGAGKLTPTAALTLAMLALSLFPATFRAALQQHQAEELTLLSQIAAAGIAVAGKNLPAAEKAGEAAAVTGLHLIGELEPPAPAPPAASQPLSGGNS